MFITEKNMRLSYPENPSLFGNYSMRLLFFATIALLLLSFIVLAPAPRLAHAADTHYSIDEISTFIKVERNGSIKVSEKRVVTFNDQNTGIINYLYIPESNETLKITSVNYAPVDNGGTPLSSFTRLQMIDSNPDQQGKNPNDVIPSTYAESIKQPWYSYSLKEGMLRCYFPFKHFEAQNIKSKEYDASALQENSLCKSYIIEINYEIIHRIRVYRDIAELFWRYAHVSLPVNSYNINLQVSLPVSNPSPTLHNDGTTVAWGHSIDEGTFNVNPDGSITYHFDEIRQGNYADAHIMFPANWINEINPLAPNQFSELHKHIAIEEERNWVDTQFREAAWDNKVRILFLIIVSLVIVIGGIAIIRKPDNETIKLVLLRMAATLGIITLFEHLFFNESLTTSILALFALILALIVLFLSKRDFVKDKHGQLEEETHED